MINSSTGDQDHPDKWISGGGSHLMGSHDNWGQVSDNDDDDVRYQHTDRRNVSI